ECKTVETVDIARVTTELDVRDHLPFDEVTTAQQHSRRVAIEDGERGRSILEKQGVEDETVAADDRRVDGGDGALHAGNDVARLLHLKLSRAAREAQQLLRVERVRVRDVADQPSAGDARPHVRFANREVLTLRRDEVR